VGFFSDLVKRFKPLEIEDGFFGHLTYMKTPSARISYWEAERRFAPTAANVELFIDAPGSKLPPNEKQRAFFNWVEQDYEIILAHIEQVLPSLFERLNQRSLVAPFAAKFSAPFSGMFHLTSFSIPVPCEGVAPAWGMSFESNTKPDFLLQVELIGADPRPDISFDFC